jgi:hypothetical protein
MTLWCNYGPVTGYIFRICREDSISFPSAWHDKLLLIDHNVIQFFPDGSYQIGGVRSASGIWALQSNETIFFDGLQHWRISDTNAPLGHQPFLNTSGWMAYKVEPDPNNLSVSFRTEIGYKH